MELVRELTDVYEIPRPERCPCKSLECEEDYKKQLWLYETLQHQATIKTLLGRRGPEPCNKIPGQCKDGVPPK